MGETADGAIGVEVEVNAGGTVVESGNVIAKGGAAFAGGG